MASIWRIFHQHLMVCDDKFGSSQIPRFLNGENLNYSDVDGNVLINGQSNLIVPRCKTKSEQLSFLIANAKIVLT